MDSGNVFNDKIIAWVKGQIWPGVEQFPRVLAEEDKEWGTLTVNFIHCLYRLAQM